MSFPVLLYVRTGENELTEMLEGGGTHRVDVARAKQQIEVLRAENTANESDLSYPFYPVEAYDTAIEYFEAMAVEEELPDNPEFDATVVGVCGLLAALE